MLIRVFLLWVVILLASFSAYAQHVIRGKVLDGISLEPLSFATVKITPQQQYVISDIHGLFSLPIANRSDSIQISVSLVGYSPITNYYSFNQGLNDTLQLLLIPKSGVIDEVVITPPYEKINAIINATVQNKARNKPNNLPQYQCNVYHKMVADFVTENSKPLSPGLQKISDSIINAEALLPNSYLLMMETFSRRSYQKAAQLKEEVIANKVSGWEKAPFASLVTDILPFDIYDDFIKLNGNDYNNPINKGWQSRYHFYLDDEIYTQKDTLYLFTFKPKGNQKLHLFTQGKVYINATHFAITHFEGIYYDSASGRSMRIEQQFQPIENYWFPHQLNYELKFRYLSGQSKEKENNPVLVLRGNSNITEVDLSPLKEISFKKAKTTILLPNANTTNDSSWAQYRSIPITEKEAYTYVFIDSIIEEAGMKGFLNNTLFKLSEYKIPLSLIDLNIDRLWLYNGYEHNRLGLGLQTNEKISSWFSVGGWAGYGFKDKAWKYGAFGEVYFDPYKDYTIRLGYQNNIQDPGRIQLHKEINHDGLAQYLMKRVDAVKQYYVNFNARLGYYNLGFGASYQNIQPMYAYGLQTNNGAINYFDNAEAWCSIRYAFGEQRAPLLKQYQTSKKSDYPVLYAKLIAGRLKGDLLYQTHYWQTLAAIAWEKNINNIGKQSFVLMGGISSSEEALPISKLFAAQGYNFGSLSFHTVGGFMTLKPYDYYADRFVAWSWKHDFNWSLYRLKKWSQPYLSLQYNGMYGSMKQATVHQYVDFKVTQKGYHETGIILNDLIKINYLNIAYLNLNAGYFYHWTPTVDLKNNGSFVLGFSFNL